MTSQAGGPGNAPGPRQTFHHRSGRIPCTHLLASCLPGYRVTRIALRLALLALAPAPLVAQAAPATDPLAIFGIRAGAPVREVSDIIADRDGGHLRCDRSKVDVRVEECRATVSVPEAAEPLELWMSAIDSVTSVLTIAGNLAPDELDQLRSSLERRYGRVDAKAQNSQWMMQWVRKGTMIRLTWRAQQGAKATSVAIIDGNVLDAWTARRGTPQKTPAKKPAKKAPAAAPTDTASVQGVEPAPAR
jgi:hypothetical protein